jgi:histidine triad (HIT) family protein
MKTLEGCTFCEVAPGAKSGIYERTIIETPNFRVFPTMGQIAEGYVLIVPKEHHACIGAMPEPVIDEFIELKDRVDKLVTEAYQKPIYFEHGVIGQTVLHAHMHVIPFNDDFREDFIERRFKSQFDYREPIQSIKDLKDIWKNFGVYLFYESHDKQEAYVTDIVPMYARIVVADALEVPERANWKTMDRTLDEKLIESTLKKLRK